LTGVIAYIGMGLLGSALAENLIKAGFTVRGYDIAPDRVREHEARGGVPARSPADAARGAAVVMTCLMTGDLVREVLLGPDGALDAAPPGLVVIDNSTIHPDASVALAGLLAERGIPMLDAPIAGSSGQARNLVLGLNRLALAEGLLFGLRQGLDGKALLAILKDSAAYSRAMDIKGERMIEGNLEAEGKLAQHLKDVELMLDVGHAAGAPLLATALHRQLLLAGVARGLGDHDNSSIIAVLRSLIAETG
jgi:3-hydroxyisobutyrate dehydrogenase-like beta-hydroxyacid dehydrogenase